MVDFGIDPLFSYTFSLCSLNSAAPTRSALALHAKKNRMSYTGPRRYGESSATSIASLAFLALVVKLFSGNWSNPWPGRDGEKGNRQEQRCMLRPGKRIGSECQFSMRETGDDESSADFSAHLPAEARCRSRTRARSW